ncbi:MAG: hypothetical protein RLZ04_427 [Actinomycetota bacterium]|jgi:uncharacterized membrane protein YhhN
MNSATVVMLTLAVGASVVDWVAVARHTKTLEYVAKPAATILFFAMAMAIDADDTTEQVWRCIALVFCLLGDVFLMLPRNAFVPGLASFAVAQVLLSVSFLVRDPEVGRAVIGGVIAVVVAGCLARRFVLALRQGGCRELVLPVVVYMIVISVMVVSAVSAASAVAIVGAVMFLLSDSIIAEHRFVRARPWKSVAIMVTYHAALAGLVLGLV